MQFYETIVDKGYEDTAVQKLSKKARGCMVCGFFWATRDPPVRQPTLDRVTAAAKGRLYAAVIVSESLACPV